MTEATVHEKKLGAHSLQFVEPDLFILRFVGDLTAAEVLELGEFYRLSKGKLYVFVDARQLGAVSADTKSMKKMPTPAAAAVCGAGMQARLALSILAKVQMVLSLGTKTVDYAFFESEAEARAWLEKIRAEKK
jgi:hypothetical protein